MILLVGDITHKTSEIKDMLEFGYGKVNDVKERRSENKSKEMLFGKRDHRSHSHFCTPNPSYTFSNSEVE